MAYTPRGKKAPLKDRFNHAVRKFFLWTGLSAAVASPFAYEYATIENRTIKVESFDLNKDGSYTIKSDKGTFNVERSRLHLQSKEDVTKMMSGISSGLHYDIKTYGWDILGGWHPNVLELKYVSSDDLQKREDALKDGNKNNTTPNTNQTPVTNTTPANTQPAGLSGEMITTQVTVNGYVVEITIPKEVAGKVTVGSVKPIVKTNDNSNNGTTPVTNTPPSTNNGTKGPGL